MKTIKSLPKKYQDMILGVSDETNNDDGWWIYLKNDYADFNFDPHNPMRTIHEQKLTDCIDRLKRDARRITAQEFEKYPHLK